MYVPMYVFMHCSGVPSKSEFMTGSCMFSTVIPSNFALGGVTQFFTLVTIGDISASMNLNGAQINQQWYRVGSSGYFYTTVKISPGNYTVSTTQPNGKYTAIIIGYGNRAGYGYICGVNLPVLTATTSTSMPMTTTTTTTSTTTTTTTTSTTATPETASKNLFVTKLSKYLRETANTGKTRLWYYPLPI